MLKYLDKISMRLTNLKNGIEKNLAKWDAVPEDPSFVQRLIDEVKHKNNEIDVLKKTLSQKYSEARAVSREKQNMLERLEKRAIGLHAENPDKLGDYGIYKKN